MKPETRELYGLVPLFKGATVWHYVWSITSVNLVTSVCGMGRVYFPHKHTRDWVLLPQAVADNSLEPDDPDWAPHCSFCTTPPHGRVRMLVGEMIRRHHELRAAFEAIHERRHKRVVLRAMWPQMFQDIDRALHAAFGPDRAALILEELQRRAPVRDE